MIHDDLVDKLFACDKNGAAKPFFSGMATVAAAHTNNSNAILTFRMDETSLHPVLPVGYFAGARMNEKDAALAIRQFQADTLVKNIPSSDGSITLELYTPNILDDQTKQELETAFGNVNLARLIRSMILKERATKTDSKTGMANYEGIRHYFNLLPELVAESANHDTQGRPTLLFMDLDEMKSTNDHFGYTVGDRMIQLPGIAAHEYRKRNLHSIFTIGRKGGDEYIIPGHFTEEQSKKLAALVQKTVQDQVYAGVSSYDGKYRIIRPNIAIGTVQVQPGENFEEAELRAEQLMKRSKQENKGTTEYERRR